MPVEGHVFQVELFFVAVLVHKGGLQLTLSAGTETLNLDLLREVHVVAAQEFEDGLFGAPVDGQLLVAFIVLQIVNLFLAQGLYG